MSLSRQDLIRERATVLDAAARDPVLQAALKKRCELDVVYFIDNFVWTFDPRKEPSDLPFKLYPFQESAAREILSAIETGEDILIEKSRDMGLSWLVCAIFVWIFVFRKGYNTLIGSRKEDLVDELGNLSTLFEKLRFTLRWLPFWLKPEGYIEKRHASFLKLLNPENGNSITGESSNPNFGRGGRYKAVLLDEFAFWPCDDAVWASLAQSTPCRIALSTPYGRANKYARLAQDERYERVLIK